MPRRLFIPGTFFAIMEEQPEDKQPLLSENEVGSFLPLQQPTVAVSTDQVTVNVTSQDCKLQK